MNRRRLLRPNPAAEWERFGRSDPYYGVYALEEFRGRELVADVRRRFFASGEEHVDEVLDLVRGTVAPAFAPRSVLDHGCGVGRLLVPFARIAEHVVGVDVSAAMLAEARRNCDSLGAESVELLHTGQLRDLGPGFELIHSALVLQHIPVNDGERIVAALARLLAPGGVGVVHLTTHARRELELYNWVMKAPLAHNALNVVRGRPWSYPHMQMNSYDLGRLTQLLRAHGIPGVHVKAEEPKHGYEACTLVFRAPSAGR